MLFYALAIPPAAVLSCRAVVPQCEMELDILCCISGFWQLPWSRRAKANADIPSVRTDCPSSAAMRHRLTLFRMHRPHIRICHIITAYKLHLSGQGNSTVHDETIATMGTTTFFPVCSLWSFPSAALSILSRIPIPSPPYSRPTA